MLSRNVKKNIRVFIRSTNGFAQFHFTTFSEICHAKFSKNGRFLRFGSEPKELTGRKEAHAALLFLIIPRGSGCRGWFSRRSVVLVFAGFRSWRFVRVRNAKLVGGRAHRVRLRVMLLERNAR